MFYKLMKSKGFIIYPGKLTVADSFRIRCIGSIDSSLMASVVEAVAVSLSEMGVKDARPSSKAIAEKEKLICGSKQALVS